MKIGIDIQALQTKGSRSRGIGRYTKSVVETLLKQTEHSYQLYANRTLPAPDLDDRRFPFNYVEYPQTGSCSLNDLLMKTTLISADIEAVFIPSPMEEIEATIPSYSHFPKKVFVVCYDLIPFIFPDRYLTDPNTRSKYTSQLTNVQNADFVFAISESTRQDAINHLNISPDRVLNVSSGVSPFFTPVPTDERQAWLKTFAGKFGISKKFILYTGGEDWRKNIEGLVKAFSQLPKNIQECYELVIACKVTERFAKEIASLASSLGISRALILTNYVTDRELRALYSNCSLFVFPSFYEGFGLPLLEAIACGAPAITSNRSSLPEIVESADLLFDPYSPEDIARVMQKVLCDENLMRSLSENAPHQAAKFSWQSVAQKMSDVFREHQPVNRINILFERVRTEKANTQVAFFSPFSPVKSGISDYSQDLLPSLKQHFSLDLYHDRTYSPDADISENLFSYERFEERLKVQDYEATIYQMGNSSYHCYMYSQLMRYSGLTVLHDYYLGGLIDYMGTNCPEFGVTLFTELEHSYGRNRAVEILVMLERGELSVHGKLSEAGIYLNRRIFTRSAGVALHNRWAYNSAINDFGHDNDCIVHIPELVPPFNSEENTVKDIRQELGISPESFIVSTFGFVSSTKRPLPILYAFKQYLSNHPLAYLVFVGGTEYLGSTDIEGEIHRLGLQGHVRITGYVHMADFYKYIQISDICLSLRFPFNGESSASLLRILSVGKPTIVTDIGSFSDFPDNVVFKIPQPDRSDEVREIAQALSILTDNSELRDSLSYNASVYTAREHSPERCARLYADFADRVRCSPEAQCKLLADRVGREMARFKAGDPEILLTPFSQVIYSNTKNKQQIKSDINFNDFLHECRSICLGKIPQAKKILSIGCAGAWYFEWFNKSYRYPVEEHIGIDLNQKPQNLPDNITWIQHDGADLSSVQSQSFDLVFAGQFIEYISWESQKLFFTEVNRVLKLGGVFVLDSPNYTVTNRYGWKQPEHVHELTFQQACDILQLSGFQIQESYGLIPESMLGRPPELVGRCLKSCFDVDRLDKNEIGSAITRSPNNCFVWWITAQKCNDAIKKDELSYRLEKLYLENQKIKNHVVFSQIGVITEKDGDYFVAVNPSSGQGFALFGPYEFYPIGQYSVEFDITLFIEGDTKVKNSPVCIVDVVTESGERSFAAKEVKLSDLLNSKKIKLDFFLDALLSLEFRIFYFGKFQLMIGVNPEVSQL